MIGSGELNSFKIGASRRIPADDLDEYVERKKREAAEASGGDDGTDLTVA